MKTKSELIAGCFVTLAELVKAGMIGQAEHSCFQAWIIKTHEGSAQSPPSVMLPVKTIVTKKYIEDGYDIKIITESHLKSELERHHRELNERKN